MKPLAAGITHLVQRQELAEEDDQEEELAIQAKRLDETVQGKDEDEEIMQVKEAPGAAPTRCGGSLFWRISSSSPGWI